MKVLSYGPPFCTAGMAPIREYVSDRGHEIRTLGIGGQADYSFTPHDTAAEIVDRLASEWMPDLLLCWCPEIAPPPRDIEHCPVKTAAIVSDWTVYFPHLEHNLARYDLVLTDALGAEVLDLPGAAPRYVMPIYSHQSDVHCPLGVERDIDIAFAGNLNHAVHVRRGRLLEQVAALSDRYTVAVASDLPPDQYTALLNRARIVFNHGLRHEMNLRCFEAVACGALLFLEAENRECPDWLKDREEAVYYREDTLLPLLRHYLDDPAECARVAACGQARAKGLAGENRMDALLDAIEAAPKGPRLFAPPSQRERVLAEAFQYASSPHEEHRGYVREILEKATLDYPGDSELQTALACTRLEGLARLDAANRQAEASAALRDFQAAALAEPQAAPRWLNLAFISRQAKNAVAEARFLELALAGTSAEGGAMLLSERRDPYISRYREALAFGNAHIETLWAGAAARLAELRLADKGLDEARKWAEKSQRWEPEFPRAYRILAQAHLALGDPETAARHLEDGLPLAPFDSDHRHLLCQTYLALERPEAAQALAEETIRIFRPWAAAAHVVEAFRSIRDRGAAR